MKGALNFSVELIGLALAGAIVGAALGLVPGLHVYNVAGALVLAAAAGRLPLSGEALALGMAGMVVGWAMTNAIPAVFLFAPDDASAGAILPATRYMLQGRGAEAVLLMGAGSLAALVALAALAPALDEILRPLRAIVQAHTGWMLMAIIAFLLLGEWPRVDAVPGASPGRRLARAWAWLGAGLLTFGLSGLLGLVLMTRSPIPAEMAFQNLLPAFVGLFALPGLVQVGLFGGALPAQRWPERLDLPPALWARGALTGLAGGLFAGFLPVISGGIGGLLAGHATAQRDERLFLVSQGASKIVYYAGSLLLLFVPGLALTRGGMAWMLTTIVVPTGWRSYALAVAALALGGALAFWLLVVFTRAAARLAPRLNPRALALAAGVVAVALVGAFTGGPGLFVAAVATPIGLIPVLVGGRRLNALGVLLLPITLNAIGLGPDVARLLGLN